MNERKDLSACWAALAGVVVASATSMLGGCKQTRARPNPLAAERTCVADSVGTLRLLRREVLAMCPDTCKLCTPVVPNFRLEWT